MPFTIGPDDPDYRSSLHARFRSPSRGVRLEASATTWWDDLTALALVLPRDGAFSHTTAAFAAGLPLPVVDPRPFHVSVEGPRGSRKAFVWHRRDLADAVEEWRGLRLTKPLRTWQDLGSIYTLSDLVVMADLMLRRNMVGVEQLRRIPTMPGARVLREAAAMADPGSRSPRESLVRVEMLKRGLPRPVLNLDIIEQGTWIGCGDFVWPEYRVIADYDGDHHNDERQRTQDNQTRDDYADCGWRHVPLTKRSLRNMDAAMERVARALRARGWRPLS
jgi:hypothetical protein